MRYILNALRSDSQYKALLAASGRAGLPCLVTELCDTLPPVLTAALMDDSPECCAHLILVPDEKNAASVKKALDCFLPESGARIYPVRDFVFNHMDSASREWEHERLSVLGALSSGTCGAVIATPDAALQLTMPVGRLSELTSRLSVGDEYAPDTLCTLLSSAGYVRAEAVEGTGQFTRRGGIVDVFCPLYESALRIEFFGDEVDSISYFDTATQRRADNIMDCLIIPCAEVLGDRAGVERARKAAGTLASKCEDTKAKERLREEQEKLSEGLEFAGIDKYIGHIFEQRACLIDHFMSAYAERRVYVIESARGKERLSSVLDLMDETVKSLLEQGLIDGKGAVYSKSASDYDSYLHSMPCVTMDSFASGKGTGAVGGIFPMRSKSASFTPASLDVLRDDALSLSQSGYSVVISTHGKSGADYIAEKLGEESSFPCLVKTPEEMEGYDPSLKAAVITWGADCGGFELPGAHFAFIRESGAPSSVKKRIMKGKDKDTQRILSYADLVPGDYVVHTNYGIGVFEGIERLTAKGEQDSAGVQKDYIKIKYAGSDALYVPCNQLDMVAKYIGAGAESGNLKLSKMGGEVWHKQKARVKAAAKEMAKKLIALYAERQNREGITYPPDGPWQKDFEATFEYDETSDQLRSAEEIREDMQRSVPMDRLLCGDVGFGKTEVALRAAFRAVSDSKQVAILVPTTILAWQHYQTILSRFRGFPVKAELLSRFRSPAQQQEALRKLKKGTVDIVVGTHRLIQDDVKFKNLGLLVVDEEQRFGVAHKERLKEMSKDIDVLTLTATPIPRTLNMALAGIRDMSVLEEGPP
ncbi:MAG: DEAD/DEAH box helicase [Eubacteriales bacterium]